MHEAWEHCLLLTATRTVVGLLLAKQRLYAARDIKCRARWARVTFAMLSDHVYHAVVGIVSTVRWTLGADDIGARLPLAGFIRVGLVEDVHSAVAGMLLAPQPLLAPDYIECRECRTRFV